MYREITKCRACSGTELNPVLDLGRQPLANDWCQLLHKRNGFYPLKVLLCGNCGLAQLSVVVDPKILYADYPYVSSNSTMMQAHYDEIFKDLWDSTKNRTLLEIASNNGDCLKAAHTCGFPWNMGVEPAENLAAQANERGAITLPWFFNLETADQIKQKFVEEYRCVPHVILARHVFAHIDDWQDFFKALEWIADEETLVAIEVPYVLDQLKAGSWDQCYHEHLSYVNVSSMYRALANTQLAISKINFYPIHGGVVMFYLKKGKTAWSNKFYDDRPGMKERWYTLSNLKAIAVKDLWVEVMEAHINEKVMGVFGASAKATVLINACGFTSREIAFVTDNSPYKPGRLVPGTDIPVIEEGELRNRKCDVLIMSAWNYKEEILAKMQWWRDAGGKFIIPIPQVTVI